MARGRQKKSNNKSGKKPIEQYEHKGQQRLNNPPVGLVSPDTDKDAGKKTYAYDPHLDPSLQWVGKAERTSFEIPTVSLHVHERIDARSIIEAVRKKNGSNYEQMSLFASKDENPPLREAIEFYKHAHNWSNRLIAGDSLLVMNSLLEKEGMAGKVQMVYFDPPYGIKYGSNFQPFVNKRDVKDGKDEDLTAEPEMVKAFRDTWELGIHSYLSYLRDRLLLARELLHESGSVFVQISDENVHHVREICDEVFGAKNFASLITFTKTTGLGTKGLPARCDYILWYARDVAKLKYRQLYIEKKPGSTGATQYDWVHKANGEKRRLEEGEALEQRDRLFHIGDASAMFTTPHLKEPIEIDGKLIHPASNRQWQTTHEGMVRLRDKGRLILVGNSLRYIRYLEDFPVFPIDSLWSDTGVSGFGESKVYVVQTNKVVVERCLLMTTDAGDLVLDVTCGSGTTAVVAEEWGRRWITCDTSRVAITLAKQRLMTAVFDYYQLAHPDEGVDSGFRYKTVPHVTLKSIANNEPPEQETLYDQPLPDNSKTRVAGPFTVEAVPAPMVKSLDTITDEVPLEQADVSIARSGETLRQAEWRAELLKAGIRGRSGQKIEFSRVEPLAGTRWLHAEAETKPLDSGTLVPEPLFAPQRAVISFGPEHAPLEQRQVALAIEEAGLLFPRPKMIIFAAFQFDPEAAKDIDETKGGVVEFLKVQMNADLLTEDLKKKRASNESFWLIGQPDIRTSKIKSGENKGKYQIEVLGFDYYDTRTGTVDSGGTGKIAMWMLDTDYDGRSLFPRQVFFPMADEKGGWAKLAKNLKAEIDETSIEAYRSTKSLPFEVGANKRVAVKIVDDRGIESLKVISLET